VEHSIESVNQLFKEKQITLNKELPAQELFSKIDRDKIQQVILNLLSNAIKFTEQNIRVKLEELEGNWVLYVEDNGSGVSTEMEELIFEKFYQAKNQTIRKPKGSGLGLAISRRIVHLHEGNLELIHKPEKGAMFCVSIPIVG
jgi:signal transduction histidine kinase